MTTTDERAVWAVDMTDRLWQCPNGQYAVQAGYMLAGFGQHRDSDPLARANYQTAQRLLCEAGGMDPDDIVAFSTSGDDIYTDPVVYGSWGHWAVGWVEELLIRVDNDAVTRLAHELHTYVAEQHPCLDDDLLMMIEADEEDE